MPNSNLVDERVVQMRMDNEQFEKGAEKSMEREGLFGEDMDQSGEAGPNAERYGVRWYS